MRNERAGHRLSRAALLIAGMMVLAIGGCSDDKDGVADAGSTAQDGQQQTGDGSTPQADQAVAADQGAADLSGTQGTGGTGGELGHSMQEMTHDGVKRIFAVHVPASYDEATPVPLLLHFHGWRPPPAEVSDEIKFVWAPTAEAQGFIAVAPEGLPCPELNPSNPYACFQQVRDGAFVKALVAHLGTLYNLDLDRLFLSGHSGGAYFVQGHGLSNHSVYVAAVTFSGGCIAASDQYGNSCSVYEQLSSEAARKIPFFVVHHASDQVVPVNYSAELLKLLKANGHPTDALSEYSPGSSGHSVDPSIVPQVWTWLSGYSLP